MPTIVRATSPAEFLALVPHLAGFCPESSLVLVPFRGHRTAGVLRLDLPPGDVTAFASTAVGMLCRMPGVDGAVAVTYCADPIDPLPRADLHGAIATHMRTCGLALIDALCVGADGWASYVNAHQHGTALERAELPDQPAPRPDQHAGVRLERAKKKDVAGMATSLRSVLRALEAVLHPGATTAHIDPRAIAAVQDLDDMTQAWDTSLTLTDPVWHSFRMAVVVWALGTPPVRDTVLATWCHGIAGGRRALEQQVAWTTDGTTPDGPLFLAGEGPRPSPARLVAGLELTRRLASLTTGAERAACLATAAWLSWALGRGTHAHAYAVHALRLDPTHGLAAIVRDLAAAGHLPAWAFTDPDGEIPAPEDA